MIPAATFTPDEDVVAALVERVTELVDGSGSARRNCYAGATQAYDGVDGIPHKAVFVTAQSGLPSRYIRGSTHGSLDERHPVVNIKIRSSSKGVRTAFRDGQALARKVFEALQYSPPNSNYCDCVAVNSQPAYIGLDDDGHHEWMVNVELTVDVVMS